MGQNDIFEEYSNVSAVQGKEATQEDFQGNNYNFGEPDNGDS